MNRIMKYGLPVFIVIVAFFAFDTFIDFAADKPQIKGVEIDSPYKFDTEAEIIQVIFETSMGNIVVDLDAEKAPISVSNFLAYVDNSFYSDTIIHRVISGFMIQAGGYDFDMKSKRTRPTIGNESFNGLRNTRGTISMARRTAPNSASSQFFFNLKNNRQLDAIGKKPGYSVFGKVTQGMDVIDKIALVATERSKGHNDVPIEEITIFSIKRKHSTVSSNSSEELMDNTGEFIAGQHYIVLDKPMPTKDAKKIEVLEAFSYGCGHCYGIDPDIDKWLTKQSSDVDFVRFPAVWNSSMKLYARAYFVAVELGVDKNIHRPLFEALVVEQKKLSTPDELAIFFQEYGVNQERFIKLFSSKKILEQLNNAERRTGLYTLGSVPEIIVNGKYRVNPMRAGGQQQLFALVDFLVNKERKLL